MLNIGGIYPRNTERGSRPKPCARRYSCLIASLAHRLRVIAEEIGEEKETVLIGLAADKAKTPQEQAL